MNLITATSVASILLTVERGQVILVFVNGRTPSTVNRLHPKVHFVAREMGVGRRRGWGGDIYLGWWDGAKKRL